MISTIFQATLAFILTGIVGSWIAHVWQLRSAKEARFFEASKEMYNQMSAAANDLSSLAGKRIYSSQRLCLTPRNSPHFDDAMTNFRASVIEWNDHLLSLELAIRTKFRHASLREFEGLQSGLVSVTSKVEAFAQGKGLADQASILRSLRSIRFAIFEFTQAMMQEAKLLHRQMHFGVVVQYERFEIDKMSTQDLIKCLFTSRVEAKPIVRSPSDFGLPVSVGDARLGIYE